MKTCRHEAGRLLVLTCFLAVAGLRADTAVLPDGRKLEGRLQSDRQGAVRFEASAGRASLCLDQVHFIALPPGPRPPRLTVRPYCVHLAQTQRFTGRLVRLDERNLVFQTSWARELVIPRGAVAALAHPDRLVTVFADDFEGGLAGWKVAGRAAVSRWADDAPRHGLRLSAPGQAVEHALDRPVVAGRVAVSFHDPGRPGGLVWSVEAAREGDGGIQKARVWLGAKGSGYRGEAAGEARLVQELPRRRGWHRVTMDFRPESILIALDDAVLWFGRPASAGPLRSVRLACEALPGTEGEVLFDDVRVSRAVDELSPVPTDPVQDEVRLASGDQLFGRVGRADERYVDVQGRFGERRLAWADVHGVLFRREPASPRQADGEWVRIGLQTPEGDAPDELLGTLRSLDDERLRLHHPVLGDLDIPRAYLVRLRWCFRGRRIDLDAGPRRLASRAAASRGPALRWSLPLDRAPVQARLALSVTTEGKQDPLEHKPLQVLLNGRPVNAVPEPDPRPAGVGRPLLLPLPAGVLRAGDNLLELAPAAEPGTGRPEACLIHDLVVEIPSE